MTWIKTTSAFPQPTQKHAEAATRKCYVQLRAPSNTTGRPYTHCITATSLRNHSPNLPSTALMTSICDERHPEQLYDPDGKLCFPIHKINAKKIVRNIVVVHTSLPCPSCAGNHTTIRECRKTAVHRKHAGKSCAFPRRIAQAPHRDCADLCLRSTLPQ